MSPLPQDVLGARAGVRAGQARLADLGRTVADRALDREPDRTVRLVRVVRRLERGLGGRGDAVADAAAARSSPESMAWAAMRVTVRGRGSRR